MLNIHRAERADALVRRLAAELATPPEDPFTPDVVAVPSKGIERWIAQTLSTSLGASDDHADGVCANFRFPPPHRLVTEVVAAASGIDPENDPWVENTLIWPLLGVIDACATEPWCTTLGRYLGLTDGGAGNGRRVSAAQKIAALFTTYSAERPTMVRDWARGDDTDGSGEPLDADLLWQPELWRRLRANMDVPSPAERIDDACRRLRDEPGLVDLPARLSLFGPTRLTTEQLHVVDALAAHHDVHLWLPHSSHGLWDRIRGTPVGNVRRRDDPTITRSEHPLVGSMARDSREMQLRLTEHVSITGDTYVGDETAATTLLGTLQRDLREDHAPTAELTLDAADRSIRVHACHGRQRQVEVLREALLGMLADDPTLEPRDIIVMCPDIETWAPLISASFGFAHLDGAHPGHRLQVRLADRSLRQTNPVLTVVARLLDLADGRLTASDLLDLAAMPPVRRRFGFDDDDLERVADWVRRSGVRWAFDAESRAPYGMDSFAQNTWQAGLDRLVVGVTMDETALRPVGLALPLDDVDSSEIDLAGRLTEFVERVGSLVGRLAGEQPLDTWVGTLVDAIDLLTAAPAIEDWQTSHARRQLTDATASAGDRADGMRLRLPDVRALLARRLAGRPTRASFRTGHLTFATLVPMRSVPHRIVCLLGLDDGVFPRADRLDGDDVLARSPRVGERDPRSEDRQLFLDAILSAKERFVAFYSGADERTGAARPPAVPLGELLDTVEQTARVDHGTVRDRVVVRHPLQPFDTRNFEAGVLGTESAFSFDRSSYAGALAATGERRGPSPFLANPLPDEPLDVVELQDLTGLLEHPAKAFLRQRLGLSMLSETDDAADALPVDLDALQKWGIGDRLLAARLSGVDRETAVHAEWLRGELPPGWLGRAIVDPLAGEVENLVSRAAGLDAGAAATIDVAVDLPDGTRVVGAVPEVRDREVVRVVYSKLGAKHRLRAWTQLLALAAAHPETTWTARTVGRRKDGLAESVIGLTDDQARAELESLVALYRAGLREPLPLAAKTSCAYAEKRHTGSPVVASRTWAARQWRQSADGREYGEFDDPAHRRVWGDATLDALCRQPRDTKVHHWPDEPDRFGQLARQVWEPLLRAEEVTDR